MLNGKLLLTLVGLFLVASSIPLDKEEKLDGKEGKRQATCFPKCANPRGFTGCGDCSESQCMLKGCVHFGAFGPVWRPDNCTVCHCSNNKMKCFKKICSTLNCYGYPKVKQPGKCCKECDFGAAKNECKLIPVALKNVSMGSDDNTDCKQVLEHDCNRSFIRRGAKWYGCIAEEGMSKLSENAGCEGVDGRYEDKIGCHQETTPAVLPQDYEADPASCVIYVH